MHGTRWFPVRRAPSPLASSLLASSLLASCLLLLCALSVVTADRGEGGGAGGRRPPAAGSIALEGGAVDGTGHVLVWHDGRWGTVCDDGWGRNAADVVCRTLGYRSALSHSVGSHFGMSTHGQSAHPVIPPGHPLSHPVSHHFNPPLQSTIFNR